MQFKTIIPSPSLQPYIKQFAISEQDVANEYKVLPTTGLVIGFQYRGKLATIKNETQTNLATAGITGLSDSYKIFNNAANTGTILVYFTETGFTQFAAHPAHELFNQSIALDNIFDPHLIAETEEKLAMAKTDKQRITIVEQFLLSQLKTIQRDQLIIEAIRIIYQTKGNIRIKELHKKLLISQSPFEKRFRKIVGTTPKKFATIVRFNTVLAGLGNEKSLTDICYEHNFFDQAHFIKNFKQFTGNTPEEYKRGL